MKGGQFLENPEKKKKKLVMESFEKHKFWHKSWKRPKESKYFICLGSSTSLPSEQENDESHDKYLLPLYCNFYFMVDLHHSVLIISSFCSSQSNSS